MIDCSEIVYESLSSLGADVYPDSAPQKANLPYVIYRVIRGSSPQDLSQSQTVHQQVVNFEVHANQRKQGAKILESISKTFKALRGEIADYFVQSFYPQNDYAHRRVSERDGTGTFRHIVTYSYRVTFNEA